MYTEVYSVHTSLDSIHMILLNTLFAVASSSKIIVVILEVLSNGVVCDHKSASLREFLMEHDRASFDGRHL